MANRLQLAEQVIRILKGYKPTADRNIDIREVAIAIDQRRDQAIREVAFQNVNFEGEGWVASDFVTAYCKVASKDKKRGLHSLVLDYEVFSLPHDKGVWYIGYADGEEDAFIPIRNGYESLLANTRFSGILGAIKPRYFIEGNKIFIKGLKGCDACELLIKQVAVSGSLGDEDDYAIPSGMEYAIVSDVLRLYGVQVQPDEINNDLDGR
jgi:hypothetical protein